MIPPKPEDLMYTTQEIGRAVIDWANFTGFTAENCGSCKATANVLAGGPGWCCPCGHYNVQSWSNSQIPHTQPKYGPPQQVILDGIKSVKYAFYSAEADALYGHCVYKVKGKETLVTIVCESKDQAKGWPDAVLVGQITIGDCVRGNNHYNSLIKQRIDWSDQFRGLMNSFKPIFRKEDFEDLIIKTPIYNEPSPPPKPSPVQITAVGDHATSIAGFVIPDKRLVVTAEWIIDGVKFIRVRTSNEFRRKYGPDAIPVYNEPGVDARWTARQEPKFRYRWVGDRYKKEPV